MLNDRTAAALGVLISTLALLACQPKADQKQQDTEQQSVSEVQDTTLTLQGNAEKLPLEIPECGGNSCPDFSVDRLHTNQFVVDDIIDREILKNLDRILEISNQSPRIQAEKARTVKQIAAVDQQLSASAAIEKNATRTAAQQMAGQVQPYVTAFLALDQELKTLGASGRINLMVSPKILNSGVNGPLATVVLNTTSYLGGAHGSSSQTYLNFDLKHQKQVELNDLLLPDQKPKLEQLAHGVFSQWVTESKLADSVPEYEQVWKFKLSSNFYLAKQGLILQYGEYEIGPYVVGLPRLVIPYAQLKNVLKQQYLPAEVSVEQAQASVAAGKG
ncbi:RsiV family protein [Acinetobacter sp. WZC-1]|uniref:RsiV family protein n=1 Tax=Acinetobacter sp. WZC-1 TaxID=3459034 RepID=UPI00403DDD3C